MNEWLNESNRFYSYTCFYKNWISCHINGSSPFVTVFIWWIIQRGLEKILRGMTIRIFSRITTVVNLRRWCFPLACSLLITREMTLSSPFSVNTKINLFISIQPKNFFLLLFIYLLIIVAYNKISSWEISTRSYSSTSAHSRRFDIIKSIERQMLKPKRFIKYGTGRASIGFHVL